MWRRGAKFLAPVSLSVAVVASAAAATAGYAFDDKGLPHKFAPSEKNVPLALAGVGMRRKNFYIVEVDVYITGLYLSSIALKAAKSCVAQGPTCQLAEEIIKKSVSGNRASAACITLNFVRTVTKSQVVDAFNEAFEGLPAAEIEKFRKTLADTVGDAGMKAGEQVVFTWLSGGGLMISTTADNASCISSPALEQRLLEVYLDPKRTVSPELVKCVNQHIGQIEA